MKFKETGLPDIDIIKRAYDFAARSPFPLETSLEQDGLPVIYKMLEFGKGLEPEFIAASLLMYSQLRQSASDVIGTIFGEEVAQYSKELGVVNTPVPIFRHLRESPNHVRQYALAVSISAMEYLQQQADFVSIMDGHIWDDPSKEEMFITMQLVGDSVMPTDTDLDFQFNMSSTFLSYDLYQWQSKNPKPPKNDNGFKPK